MEKLLEIIFTLVGGRVANDALDIYLKKLKEKQFIKTLETNLKQKYGDDYDYYINEAIAIFQRAPLNDADWIKKHDFDVKKIVSALCDHHPKHKDDKDKIRDVLSDIIYIILQQRPDTIIVELLNEQSDELKNIANELRILKTSLENLYETSQAHINNIETQINVNKVSNGDVNIGEQTNNYGISDETLNTLKEIFIREGKAQGKLEAEAEANAKFEEYIKKHEKLEQKSVNINDDSSEVKQAMDKAHQHIDSAQYDNADKAIDYALSLENQPFARSDNDRREMTINRAKKYELKGDIALQKFDYVKARDNYIEAYQTITDNLGAKQYDDNIRQIQSDYLNSAIFNAVNSVLFNDKKTNDYAQLAYGFNKQHFGDKNLNTLNSINNLAALYEKQGHYEEAETLYIEALEKCTDKLGRDHAITLTTINNLAGLYESQGRYNDAEPLFQEALEANKRILGRDHPNTLKSLNNLGYLYQSQERYEEAQPLLEEVLKRRTAILGYDHPDTLISLNNLGYLYQSQGRDNDAQSLYLQGLEASERILGREHSHTLNFINNLGLLYHLQGRYNDAELLYQEALQASERVLGRKHPETLLSINNLAGLYAYQERYQESLALFIEALAGYKKIFPNGHPNVDVVEENLKNLREKIKEE